MKQRSRSLHSPSRSEPYLKFLKPGALAQLRNSRISARSHQADPLSQIPTRAESAPPPLSDAGQPIVNATDDFPCFSPRVRCGPRFPQRRRLVAAKAALFLRSRPASPVASSPDPILNMFNNNSNNNNNNSESLVVAH